MEPSVQAGGLSILNDLRGSESENPTICDSDHSSLGSFT